MTIVPDSQNIVINDTMIVMTAIHDTIMPDHQDIVMPHSQDKVMPVG